VDSIDEEVVEVPKGIRLAGCHARDKSSVVMERRGIERKHDESTVYSLLQRISIMCARRRE
jgi:hypothetical protein